MYVIEYVNPYSDSVDSKKFKGKYAPENAFGYAKRRYEDYYMSVPVCGYEIIKGKKVRKFCFGSELLKENKE